VWLNWLSATAFEKPHSLRHGNRLILQVENCGNQCSVSIRLMKVSVECFAFSARCNFCHTYSE
jgi:hypothetical protein